MVKKFLCLCLIIFGFLLPLRARDIKSESPVESITLEELRDHVFYLASDELGGRVVGTQGFEIATHYVASQFRAAGLQNVLKDSKGHETYLQKFPVMQLGMKVNPLIIQSPTGSLRIAYREQFKMFFHGGNLKDKQSYGVVFIGYGIREKEHGWDDLEGVEIEDKVVVMLSGAPMRNGKPVLPRDVHRPYASQQTLDVKLANVLYERPAAILYLNSDLTGEDWQGLRDITRRTQFQLIGDSKTNDSSAGKKGWPGMFSIKWELIRTLFKNQDYSPVNIERDGIKGYKTYQLRDTGLVFGITPTTKKIFTQNIVGVVKGTDPSLRNQYLTIGAHLDHLPPLNGQIRNGADDNASGSAGVLEIAEAIAMKPLRRPVIFILYTLEESGMLGSAYFVNHCPVPLKNITMNINLDTIGRTCDRLKENRSHYVVGHKDSWAELKKTIELVNRRSNYWPLTFATQDSVKGNSDHHNFIQKGIPAVFIWSGRPESWHKPNDDADTVEYDKLHRISQLVYETLVVLGNKN